MKTTLISLILICGITVTRADLTMKLNLAAPKMKIIVKIKGDKIRYDFLPDGGYGNMSRIVDLDRGNDFILDDASKKVVNRTFSLPDYTNAVMKAEWPKLQDTGKTEMLNGYKADIYKWINTDNMVEMLWVAKNYPKFDKIKNDLVKLDFGKLDNKKMWMPKLASLSGMPLKLLFIAYNSNTNEIDAPLTLISEKEESIDDTNFYLPKDYYFESLPSAASTNAFVANTNEVISTTNELPTK